MELLAFIIAILAASCVTAQEDQKERSPLFYGWFFNEVIAEGLQNITGEYLGTLYSEVPAVQNFLKNVSSQKGIKDPLKYYTKPTDPNTGKFDPYYHITAFYCGYTDCSNYTRQIEKYLNKNFSTDLVGIFFTPRTYGIRVNLSDIQKDIFELGASLRGFEATEISMTPAVRLNPGNAHAGIDFVDQDSTNFHPTDTRAHVTLGCAPNVTAVTTGTDLLEILELENLPKRTSCGELIKTERGNLVQMGKDCDVFVYYLNQKMVANGAFEVYFNRSSKPSGGLARLWSAILLVVSTYWM